MRFRLHQDDARSATRQLLLLFVVLLTALVLAVNALMFVLWWVLASWAFALPQFFFETNTALVLLFVLGGCAVETARLRIGGGDHVAHWAGGREVFEARSAPERRLLNVVDEMAIASGLPRPRVYVLDREDAINAFASGWTADDAVIAVTRGALERLSRDELQGLVAHEFGHIQQDDLRLHMVLLALVWGLSLVHGFGAARMAADGEGRRSPVGVLVGAVFVAAGSLGWLAGRVLQAAVSRQRELLADACAVQFTRSRDGLGGTLRKVWHQSDRDEDRLRHVPTALMAAMLLQAPAGWLASHPPLPERLRRLYGHEVEPLPAPMLKEIDDEPAPRVAYRASAAMPLVPLSFPAVSAAAYAAPMPPSPSEPDDDDAPSAVVPQPRPVADADLREAMGRLARLNGQGELRAAILALVLTPGSRRERRAWRDETRGLATAAAIYADVLALGPASRLPWLETLLDRAARASISDRQALVEAARRVMAADGMFRPIDRLLWLAMRRRLAAPLRIQPATDAHNDIAQLPDAMRLQVVRLTAFLSRLVPDGLAASGESWHRRVISTWSDSPPPCVPPEADGLVHALAEVQSLPWMLRPVLVRAWFDAALVHSPMGQLTDIAADALRLACYLLDSPMPPELARHYIETPAP